MSLASVIRLEFAYPGVGILAGDSLQYLSIATAHGVIMVFFMIMPVVFGAFGNFLLPTQLGVHDVAFPRLNSAAFWFLPGGLIMLMQLVCVDRRYQRMNCFNIRELQGVLKRKFFTDLVNTNDHRDFLNQSMVGLRFKSNNSLSITPDLESFFNFGTTTNSKSKTLNFTNNYFPQQLTLLTDRFAGFELTSLYAPNTIMSFIMNLFNIFTSVNVTSLFTFLQPSVIFTSVLALNTSFVTNTNIISSTQPTFQETQVGAATVFSTENLNFNNAHEGTNALFSETSNNARFTRFNNPLISYDYKCGHYLGI